MYGKLFASLYQGTLRGNAHGILVFTNLIAHCDRNGIVDKHFRAIAEEVGLTVDEVKAAILQLEAPDNESRSPELDGRRIVRMDEHRVWGWSIVNYAKYRNIRNEDDRKEQNRRAQERWRNKNKQSKPSSAELSRSNAVSAQAEAEAEADKSSCASAAAEREKVDDKFARFWTAYPKKKSKGDALKAWKKLKPTEELLQQMLTAIASLRQCPDWQKEGGQYIPYPGTWLRAQGWEDETGIEVNGSDEAVRAWTEVREANRSGRKPEHWTYRHTAEALATIGGFGRLADMQTIHVPERQREFVSAYTAQARATIGATLPLGLQS